MKNPLSVSSAGFPSQSDIAPVQTVQGRALKGKPSVRADFVTVLVCCPLRNKSWLKADLLFGLLLALFLRNFLLRFLFSSHDQIPCHESLGYVWTPRNIKRTEHHVRCETSKR